MRVLRGTLLAYLLKVDSDARTTTSSYVKHVRSESHQSLYEVWRQCGCPSGESKRQLLVPDLREMDGWGTLLFACKGRVAYNFVLRDKTCRLACR